MYKRPYTIEEIKKNYPDKAEILLKDPLHLWRAETGIELIHKEPLLEEQKRIWENWNEMTDEMKKKSDEKSIELFDKNNATHNEEIMRSSIENNILKLGKYKHFKGKEYEVIGVAKHSETLEKMIIYRALYGKHDIWARPFKMFLEKVEIDGKKIQRFKYVKQNIKKSLSKN